MINEKPGNESKITGAARSAEMVARAKNLYLQTHLSRSDIRCILEIHNETCNDPPLSDSEIESIVNSVTGKTPPGESITPELSTSNGVIIQAPIAAGEKDEYPESDAGNAEYLAALYGKAGGNLIRYDHVRKRWLIWQGNYWQDDEGETVIQIAKLAMRSRRELAENLTGKDREKRIKHTLKSEDIYRLKSMIGVALSEDGISDNGIGWDNTPYLLGTVRGVIDLRTGKGRPGAREDRIRRAVNHCEPDAKAPRWERFLQEVFINPELVEWLQRAVGYSITGDVSQQCFFLCYGTGANGKTTFLEALSTAFYPYSYTAPFSVFTAAKFQTGGEAPTPVMAQLDGPRFVKASEVREGARFDEGRIKELTGGGDINVRRLRESPFIYTPRFHLWFGVNHKPRFIDDSAAFSRRIRLIPFNQTFDPNIEPDLESTLRAEAPGILNWAIRGAMLWYEDQEIGPAPESNQLVLDWIAENDPLVDFEESICVIGETKTVRFGDLYNAYLDYCEREKVRKGERLSRRSFSSKLQAKGYKTDKRAGNVTWIDGIGLKAKNDEF